MKINRLLLFIIVSTAILLSACQSGPELHSLNGSSLRLSDLRGKWVLLNYWASWCKSCYQEVQEVNAFYEKNKDHNVVVLGINYDQVPQTQLKKIVEKMQVHYPVLLNDPAELFGITSIPGLPATYVFDQKGKLVQRLLGPQTQSSLKKWILDKQPG